PGRDRAEEARDVREPEGDEARRPDRLRGRMRGERRGRRRVDAAVRGAEGLEMPLVDADARMPRVLVERHELEAERLVECHRAPSRHTAIATISSSRAALTSRADP